MEHSIVIAREKEALRSGHTPRSLLHLELTFRVCGTLTVAVQECVRPLSPNFPGSKSMEVDFAAGESGLGPWCGSPGKYPNLNLIWSGLDAATSTEQHSGDFCSTCRQACATGRQKCHQAARQQVVSSICISHTRGSFNRPPATRLRRAARKPQGTSGRISNKHLYFQSCDQTRCGFHPKADPI